MANKELVIKTTVDTSGVDKAMQELRQKMSQTQGLSPNIQGSQLGIGDRLSLAAQNDVQRYNQKMQDDLRREHSLRQAQYKQSLDAERDLKRFKESGQDVEKEINQELEKRIKLLKEMKEIQEKMGDGGGRVPPTGGGGAGGQGPERELPPSPMNWQRLIGGAATIAQITKVVMDRIYEDPRIVTMARGAVGSQILDVTRESERGLGIEALTFAPERLAALRTVSSEMGTARMRDVLGGLGNIGGAAALGFGAGGPMGALGAGGLALASSGPQMIGAMFNTEAYQAMQAKEFAEKLRQTELAERAKNVEKTFAYDVFKEKYGTISSAQQLFGLEDPIGFLTNVTGGGKRADAAKQLQNMIDQGSVRGGGAQRAMLESIQAGEGDINMRGVSSAKGVAILQELMSTSGITQKDTSIVQDIADLQAGGLTNAGTIMGRIQALGTDTQGKKELEMVFRAATAGGIKDSGMVEEQRKFADMATSVAMQRGTDAGVIADLLSRGMLGTSAVQMGAAATTLDYDQSMYKGLQGAGGARKMAYMYSPKVQEQLKGSLNQADMSRLFTLTEDELTGDTLEYYQQKTGLDRDNLVGLIRGGKDVFSTPRGDTRERIQGLRDKMSKMSPEEARKAVKKDGELFGDFQSLISIRRLEDAQFASFTEKQREAQIFRELGGPLSEEFTSGLLQENTQRGADSITRQMEKAQGVSEGAGLQNLGKFIGKFAEDAEKMANTSGLLQTTMKNYQELLESGVNVQKEYFNKLQAIVDYADGKLSQTELQSALSQQVQPVAGLNNMNTGRKSSSNTSRN